MAAVDRLAKAQRYLRSSELLLHDDDFESAVSRAYYGVLHTAKAILIAYGRAEVEGWKTHPQVLTICAREDWRYTWFRGVRPFKGTRELLRSLTTLHALRVDADYEIGYITSSAAQETLRFARDFIRRVEEKVNG